MFLRNIGGQIQFHWVTGSCAYFMHACPYNTANVSSNDVRTHLGQNAFIKSLSSRWTNVLHAGIIVGGEGGVGGTGSVITAGALIKQLQSLAKNKGIAAVVLRIDSGGGDALASDLMWREIKKLSDKKPVVASMGDVAASGGCGLLCLLSVLVNAALSVELATYCSMPSLSCCTISCASSCGVSHLINTLQPGTQPSPGNCQGSMAVVGLMPTFVKHDADQYVLHATWYANVDLECTCCSLLLTAICIC